MSYLIFKDLSITFKKNKKNNRQIIKRTNLNEYPLWYKYIEKLKFLENTIKENFLNIESIYKEIKKLNKIDNLMYNLEESLCKLIKNTEQKLKSKNHIFQKLNYVKLEYNEKEQIIISNLLIKNKLNNKNFQKCLFQLDKYFKDIIGKYDNDNYNNNNNKEINQGGNGQNQLLIQNNTNKEKQIRIKKIYNDTILISNLIKNIEEQVFMQGEYIDRIDNNLNSSEDYLKKANNELFEIYKEYNNWSYRLQIFFFIVINICCILILIKWI